MKSANEKKQFIEMRAEGISYDKISSKLNVSKPTLIKWGKECEKEIANLHFFEIDMLLDQYRLSRRFRMEQLAVTLSKALDELNKRTFDDMSIKDLVNLTQTLDQKLRLETSSLRYHTGEYTDPLEDELLEDAPREHLLPFRY